MSCEEYGPALARHYDRLILPGIVPLARQLAREIVGSGASSACDFGCGSGYLVALLREAGVNAVGCDLSPAMVEAAGRRSGMVTAKSVVVSDMVSFRPVNRVDYAICLYDTVNHLNDLCLWESFFANVASSVVTDGVFVFDMITCFDLEQCWPGHSSVACHDDLVCVRLACLDRVRGGGIEEILIHELVEGTWATSTEQHRRWAFAEDLVVAALRRAGFATITVSDAETREAPRPESQRLLFRCVVGL